MTDIDTDPPSYGIDRKQEDSSDLENNKIGEPVPYTGLVDEKEFGHVRRGLKSRHVQFIAIGGIIGTGLFVGSGAALVRAGPLSILLAYTIVGTVIYSLMLAIGEVCPAFLFPPLPFLLLSFLECLVSSTVRD
jgi:amino acid transporter